MTTYYVAKTGDDGDPGTSQSAPKLTIQAALTAAAARSDTVEIIDEGVYNEGDLTTGVENITLHHTASTLGRPEIHGTGLGGNAESRAFDLGYSGFSIKGLEIYSYGSYPNGCVFNVAVAARVGLVIEDCFMYDVPRLTSHNLAGTSGDPCEIKQCIMYFEGSRYGNTGLNITNNGYLEISNCLLTASNKDGDWPVVSDSSAFGTASFSTIIDRGTISKSTMRIAKAINCFVSSSTAFGIASDDQTYNLACVTSGFAFRNNADGAIASPASGSGNEQITHAEVGFVDNTSIGDAVEIADNYKLTYASKLVDAGSLFDDIVIDLAGTLRPCRGYDVGCFEYTADWSEYTAEPKSGFDNELVIQSNANLSSNHKFKYCSFNRQAPFSLGVKGPASLRGRTTAYKVEK